MDRREFIRDSLIVTAGAVAAGAFPSCSGNTGGAGSAMAGGTASEGPLELEWEDFTAEMKYTFSISGSSRNSTPIVLTRLHWCGFTGYGEASMPPYLGESHESVNAFLRRVSDEVLPKFRDAFLVEDILAMTDSIAPGNCAAKASVDIALHDLLGKVMGQPWWRIWGFDPNDAPYTCYTIGYDASDDIVRRKTSEASWSRFLKVKLGQTDAEDRRMIRLIREICPDTPIYVDANQGWKDRMYAAEMAGWLAENGVVMIEQPMPKDDIEGNGYVNSKSPVPVIADESCQRLSDIPKLHRAFSGVNIKLMKCTGMHEAREMITLAQALGMDTMIGCMTETSVAISAAAQLSPKMRWADLDGNILIANDCFSGMKLREGRITLDMLPGIGVKPL